MNAKEDKRYTRQFEKKGKHSQGMFIFTNPFINKNKNLEEGKITKRVKHEQLLYITVQIITGNMHKITSLTEMYISFCIALDRERNKF